MYRRPSLRKIMLMRIKTRTFTNVSQSLLVIIKNILIKSAVAI